MTSSTVKAKSLSQLENDLDDVFRDFIVLRDFFPGCKCFVCGSKINKKHEGEVGHFVPRGNMATRFDEDNCNFICVTCNRFDPNHNAKYRFAMELKKGEFITRTLEKMGKSMIKRMKWEVQEMILDYRDKVAKIRKEKGL